MVSLIPAIDSGLLGVARIQFYHFQKLAPSDIDGYIFLHDKNTILWYYLIAKSPELKVLQNIILTNKVN